MGRPKKILVCILNWGLGHATRCIPILQELQRQGAEVSLASDGRALQLLEKEFPALPIYSLPAYDISYRTGNMFLNIAPQLPKIYKAIRAENIEIKRLVKEQKFDIILSDNRFGCYHSEVKSVFMTHQLRIKMPFLFLEKIIESLNKYWIKKFDTCWVPDTENELNLSGDLSHNIKGIKVSYLGWLSRMHPLNPPIDIKYDALILLSGPEPQRTYLETLLLQQALELDERILVIQGKTEKTSHQFLNEKIEIISYLTTQDLNQAMAASKVIISRSGYSTLMDLAALGKKAILIPTPGQTEQEYLASIFYKKKIFYTASQKNFDLKKALSEVNNFSGIEIKKEERLFLRKNVAKIL